MNGDRSAWWRLFKHTGDGVLAAFSSPNEAVAAAIDAQRTLELPVRMGLATGEAELRGDDYFGPTLNRAARVMTAGHGGAKTEPALGHSRQLPTVGLKQPKRSWNRPVDQEVFSGVQRVQQSHNVGAEPTRKTYWDRVSDL